MFLYLFKSKKSIQMDKNDALKFLNHEYVNNWYSFLVTMLFLNFMKAMKDLGQAQI